MTDHRYLAGQVLTAADLERWQTRVIYKAANQTITSSITLTNDPELLATVDAGATYVVELHLIGEGIEAADIQTAWTIPSGASGQRIVVGPTVGTTSGVSTQVRARGAAWTLAMPYGLDDASGFTAPVSVIERGTLTTTTAGTLQLQWAQNTSNATGTVVRAGSHLTITRQA